VRKAAVLTLAVALAARFGAAQTEVRRVGDTLDVRATAAPVAEVLDRIARETGMKVTYDGPPPRARVSVTLAGVTPAQAVLRVLEGQGLNYALRMDARAVRVETLLMVAGSGAGTVAPPTPTRPLQGTRQIDREPDVAEPDDETPAETPGPSPEEQQRKPFPFPGGPSGPAMPLMLPMPPPPTTAASPSPAAPQNPQD
jgi:hypothetical protein